jgi:hypothetical protein
MGNANLFGKFLLERVYIWPQRRDSMGGKGFVNKRQFQARHMGAER